MSQASLEELDDPTLVARCRERDDDAWRVLVRRYRSLVYSSALRAGADDTTADDVFQHVWLELHRSLDHLRDPQALPRWLVVTTRRVAYRFSLERDRPVDGGWEDLVDPAALPDSELQALQDRQRLQQLIDGLGGTCTQLLTLLFLDPAEPDYRRISQLAGVAVGSIGPLRARCLDRLRQRWEESA